MEPWFWQREFDIEFYLNFKLDACIMSECNNSMVLGTENHILPSANTMLRHEKIEEISEKGLRALQSKGIGRGFTICSMDFNFYEHCVSGKRNWVNFSTSTTRVNRIFFKFIVIF